MVCVIHMLNGKAYDRAVRGHLLVDAALNAMLIADAFHLPQILVHHDAEDHQEETDGDIVDQETDGDIVDQETDGDIVDQETDGDIVDQADNCSDGDISNEETLGTEENDGDDAETDNPLSQIIITEARASIGDEDLDTAAAFLEEVIRLEGNVSPNNNVHEALSRISSKLQIHKEQLSTCRTGKFWLQYMDMVAILRRSIKAERTGNFLLHLQCVKDMLPYFAASGHHHYLKSARLYLEQMLRLEQTHPKVYQSFLAGHHTVRRSDRYWAGLSLDLLIEQVLMRSLKTNGGLTRGSGMGEKERLVWLLSMPACAHVNSAMQLATGVAFTTSEQHKDLGKTRQNRDHNDVKALLRFFQKRNPSNLCGNLRNLSNGRTAEETVNVDTAKDLGQIVVDSMTGLTVSDFKLRKRDHVVTLTTKVALTKGSEQVYIDPTLLFQRLVKIAESSPDTVSSVFEYELTNIPSSLFEMSGLPRPAKKHMLADYIWSLSSHQNNELPDGVCFVLDGGDLLHRLPWSRGVTYDEVIQSYVDFVVRNYGRGASIIFDGYSNGPSIKDATHLRRQNECKIACDINFAGDMLVCDTKTSFLANENNKQCFIDSLSTALLKNDIVTYQAEGDADCLIVSTALNMAEKRPVALVGRDTDLLILLLYHLRPQAFNVFFVTGARVWDIKRVKEALGQQMCNNILFGHAYGDCDTTSSLFSIGKKTLLVKLKDSSLFRQQAEVFSAEFSSKDAVITAGEKALVLLYGGKENDSLNAFRYVKYLQQLSTCTRTLEPKRLPPTSSSAQFHSLRTYFQVKIWMKLKDDKSVSICPTDWGWEVRKGIMLPVYTDAAAAPEDLPHVVKCSCKTDCTSARCSCRRHGLFCTAGCGECRGETCMNSMSKTETVSAGEVE